MLLFCFQVRYCQSSHWIILFAHNFEFLIAVEPPYFAMSGKRQLLALHRGWRKLIAILVREIGTSQKVELYRGGNRPTSCISKLYCISAFIKFFFTSTRTSKTALTWHQLLPIGKVFGDNRVWVDRQNSGMSWPSATSKGWARILRKIHGNWRNARSCDARYTQINTFCTIYMLISQSTV